MSIDNVSAGPAPPGGLAASVSPSCVDIKVVDNKTPSTTKTKATVVSTKDAPVTKDAKKEAVGGVLTCVSEVGMMGIGMSRDDFMTMVTLRAPTKEGNRRPPVDTVLVVDRSGSVSTVLSLIQTMMRFVVEKQMSELDRLSIVSYSHECTVDLPLMLMDQHGKNMAEQAISRLIALGGTDMGLALHTADQVLKDCKQPNDVRAMLVFTDGKANNGPAQSADDLVRIITDPNFFPSLINRTAKPLAPPVLSSSSNPPLVGVVWEWSEQPDPKAPIVWTAYDVETTHQLETALMNNTPLLGLNQGTYFQTRDGYFAILDERMRQINLSTKFERPIRRIINNCLVFYSATLARTVPTPRQPSLSSFSSSSASSTSISSLFAGLTTVVNKTAKAFGSVSSTLSSANHPPANGATAANIANIAKTATKTDDGEQGKSRSVYTFGLNGTEGHDGKCLKEIADAGHGTYTFIEDGSKIGEYFADCMGGLLSVMMQRIRVRIATTKPGVTIRNVLTHFPVTFENAEKTAATITIPDMQSEESKDILIQLVIPTEKSTSAALETLLTVDLVYHDMVLDREVKETGQCVVIRCGADEPMLKTLKPHYGMDMQRNRLRATEVIEKARTLGDDGKYNEARQLLQAAISEMRQSQSAKDSFTQAVIKDLLRACDAVKNQESYNHGGSCGMASMSSAHQQQRATPSAAPIYASSARAEARKTFSSFSPSTYFSPP
jgi:hypothetical protein